MPTDTARPMQAPEWLQLGLLSILWGASFFFVELGLRELPPLTLVLVRLGLAAMALLLVARFSRRRLPREGRVWGTLLVMALLNNVLPFSLIGWGQTAIAGGLASILNATTPLWTVLLAHVLTRDEKMRPHKLVGVLIGFAGVVAMIGPAALGGLGVGVLAQLAVLLAAFSYACSSIVGRRFRGMDPLAIATGQLTLATVLMLPLAGLVETPWRLAMPGPTTWAAMTGLALLSTAFAYILFFRVLGRAGATNVQLVTFLVPVSALALNVALLGERLLPQHLIGMALIGAGLAAIDGRLLRRAKALASGPDLPDPAGR